MTRDEVWLAGVVKRAETLDEARLAVSIFLTARHNKRPLETLTAMTQQATNNDNEARHASNR